MKENALWALLLFASLMPQGTALGQASFWMYNGDPSVDAPVFDSEGTPLDGGDYLAELWGGSMSNSLSPTLTFYTGQRVMVPFTYGPGYFLDDYAGRFGEDDLAVFDVPPGGWAWLEVRAWDARLGSNYEEVVALGIGGYGESPLFYARGSVPGLSPPALPAPLLGLQSFSLRPIVPEPSTFALAGLGAAALLVFRRRK
jgi:hypothetical protein